MIGGFFRNTRAGLGKTGINRAFVGRRSAGLNIGTLGKKTEGGYYDSNDIALEPKRFCNLASNEIYEKSGEPSGAGRNFYSFDASQVYNSITPVLGSHGDLREHVSVLACDKADYQEKRRFSMNFIINFTKKDFRPFLD